MSRDVQSIGMEVQSESQPRDESDLQGSPDPSQRWGGRCATSPEYWKPEVFKPPVEKEFKPEGLINEQLVEKITVRVIEALKQRGAIK